MGEHSESAECLEESAHPLEGSAQNSSDMWSKMWMNEEKREAPLEAPGSRHCQSVHHSGEKLMATMSTQSLERHNICEDGLLVQAGQTIN